MRDFGASCSPRRSSLAGGRAKIAVTDQEISDFFAANRAIQFNMPEESYHVVQIVVTPVRDARAANRTGDDAGTPQEAAAEIQMLMERLKAGASFRDLAIGYSEDPESAPRGGDLGFRGLVSQLSSATPVARRRAEQGGLRRERGELEWRLRPDARGRARVGRPTRPHDAGGAPEHHRHAPWAQRTIAALRESPQRRYEAMRRS